MATWARRSDTRDPLVILLEREARTCKGCIHHDFVWQQPWCLKQQKPAKCKCSRYREVE